MLARRVEAQAAAAAERERERELARRDEELERREAQERHAAKLRDEWRDQDERLARREAQLEKRQEVIDAKDRALEERAQKLGESEDELKLGHIEHERLLARAREDVLRIAGLSREDAMRAALERLDEELRDESAARVRRMQERLDEELEMRTQKALAHSMSRIAIRTVTEGDHRHRRREGRRHEGPHHRPRRAQHPRTREGVRSRLDRRRHAPVSSWFRASTPCAAKWPGARSRN
jgi:ribonuclease Y